MEVEFTRDILPTEVIVRTTVIPELQSRVRYEVPITLQRRLLFAWRDTHVLQPAGAGVGESVPAPEGIGLLAPTVRDDIAFRGSGDVRVQIPRLRPGTYRLKRQFTASAGEPTIPPGAAYVLIEVE